MTSNLFHLSALERQRSNSLAITIKSSGKLKTEYTEVDCRPSWLAWHDEAWIKWLLFVTSPPKMQLFAWPKWANVDTVKKIKEKKEIGETEESYRWRFSPKRLVHQNKFDTFERIFAFYSTFEAVSRIFWVFCSFLLTFQIACFRSSANYR